MSIYYLYSLWARSVVRRVVLKFSVRGFSNVVDLSGCANSESRQTKVPDSLLDLPKSQEAKKQETKKTGAVAVDDEIVTALRRPRHCLTLSRLTLYRLHTAPWRTSNNNNNSNNKTMRIYLLLLFLLKTYSCTVFPPKNCSWWQYSEDWP